MRKQRTKKKQRRETDITYHTFDTPIIFLEWYQRIGGSLKGYKIIKGEGWFGKGFQTPLPLYLICLLARAFEKKHGET